MVWFECTDCGESLKKPKVQNHTYSCSASAFNCIDCGRTFDRYSVKDHTTCVTEHEKYAKGATKPGGYAASGFYGNGGTAKAPDASAPAGLAFLTARPPWKCNICNVSCTSQETLMGHASGAKHKRRAKAAMKQADGPSVTAAETAVIAAPATAADSEHAEDSVQLQLPTSKANTGESMQSKAEKGGKKGKRKAEAASVGLKPGTSSKRARDEPIGEQKKEVKMGCQQGSMANGHLADKSQRAGQSVADRTEPHKTGESEPQPLKQTKQRRQKQAAAPDLSKAGGAVESPGDKGPRWAKLAKEILASCEGHRMKLAKLQRKVVAAAGLPKHVVADHREAIMQRLSSKRKSFAVIDGEVWLKVAN